MLICSKYDDAKHRNFVYKAYLTSQRAASGASAATDRQYYDVEEPLLERLLAHPTTVCLVATHPEEDDLYYGVIIGRHGRGQQSACIDFVYTKKALRGYGVARGLYQELRKIIGPPLYASHYPHVGWQRKRWPELGLKYNMYSRLNVCLEGILEHKYGEQNWELVEVK